jgi:DNA polymerase-3 subunit gamma/tau
LIKKIQDNGDSDAAANNVQLKQSLSSDLAQTIKSYASPSAHQNTERPSGQGSERASLALVPFSEHSPARMIKTLEDVHEIVTEAKELVLASEIYNYIELVKIKDGVLEIAVRDAAMAPRIKSLQKVLSAAMDARWMVSFVPASGIPTLAEKADAARKSEFNDVLAMPIMQDIMRTFPGAELVEIINEGEK